MYDKITTEITAKGVVKKFLNKGKTVLEIKAPLQHFDVRNVIFVTAKDEDFEALSEEQQADFFDSLHLDEALEMSKHIFRINFPDDEE